MLIIAVVPRGHLKPAPLAPASPLCEAALDLIAAHGARRVVVRDYAGDRLLSLSEARRMNLPKYDRDEADPSRGFEPGRL